jgi:DNA-binding protein HU-beta
MMKPTWPPLPLELTSTASVIVQQAMTDGTALSGMPKGDWTGRSPAKMQESPGKKRFSLCTTAASGLNAATALTKQRPSMAKALSKSQIAATVAEKVGITKKQAVQSLETLVELAYKNAKNTFTIPGLGKLVLVNRKARMGRNPATGATIKIAAKRVVKFRVAKAAKDAILGKK